MVVDGVGMSRRAVFLDRDGVLTIPNFRNGRSYAPRTLADFALYEDVPKAMRTLSHAGYALVVVTNQPDIGNGLITMETLEEMHRILLDSLPIDRIEVCMHTQKFGCGCRKPATGMLISAAEHMDIDLTHSYMIGDRASDIDAGSLAGCTTIFIDRKYQAEASPLRPDHVCGCLGLAADWIMKRHEDGGRFGKSLQNEGEKEGAC